MTYLEAQNFITNKQRLGIIPGLSRILSLLDKMDNPQDKLKIIHIAGTNGKGTVGATIADALVKAGYKVGRFSSPWVVDYLDQIEMNNKPIDEQAFADYVEEYRDNDCTEFEFLTAIMYKYFADSHVDYAVVECGMGGKNDSTNVERENISVITSISLDHTGFFGDTIEAIAKEKCGILRSNCPCVLYPNAGLDDVFAPKCKRLIKVEEANDYNVNNLNTAKAVLDLLGVDATAQLVKLPARQEMINGVMVDGAHNVDGARALVKNFPKGNVTAIIGMMSDKDVDGYLSLVAPLCNRIITTTPNNPRSISARELGAIAKNYCNKVDVVENPVDAIKLAKDDKAFSLACGSFYLAREIRNLI